MMFLIPAVCLIAAAVILSVCGIRRENRHFKVTEYEVKSGKVKRPVTLAVLADLHNYSYGERNADLYRAICDSTPDLVISCGDMIVAESAAGRTLETTAFLKQLAEHFPFFYGCGNHEYRILHRPEQYGAVLEAFREHPHIYDNENLDLPELGIRIFGLDLETEYFGKFFTKQTDAGHIRQLVGDPAPERLNLLIGHNPDQLDAYADWGADLILAGHVHGGMIALPGGRGLISPAYRPFPKYYAGIYHKGHSDMIVSRGLGNHLIHIRIFNRAELLVVRILPEQ